MVRLGKPPSTTGATPCCPRAAGQRTGQTEEEPWHVLADPEGNEFCLLKTRLHPL
ncbi:VOC family protein [Streptomyces coffeae]|uniref:VOC family protein n=1 Tax=Streptomyces coffeae TaxID=621382 RepID=UPI003558C48A